MPSTRLPAWISEDNALAYIIYVVGSIERAWREYLEAARAGELEVYGRRAFMAHFRELIPREEWLRAEWLELPDPLSTGFHFLPVRMSDSWTDREVRREVIEAMWPLEAGSPTSAAASKPTEAPKQRKRGPRRGTTNRVQREREALIPTLQAARQPGEARNRTIARLEEAGQLKLPGTGDRKNMIDLLARVWGKKEQ